MPVLTAPTGAPEAPQQHKQASRKGKKAWRKHVDVSEVEKGLEVRNLQIIQGGLVSKRDSSELFVLDVGGDPALPKKFNKHIQKVLTADKILAQRSAVAAVPRCKRADAVPKTTDGVLSVKRPRLSKWISHEEVDRLRRIRDGNHESAIDVTDASYDVWDAEDTAAPAVLAATATKPKTATIEKDPFSFLPKIPKTKAPKTLRRKAISLSASGKPIPAVARPNGGYSYNPSFPDYEARFLLESAKAVKAEKRRLAEKEAEHRKREAAALSAAEADAAETRADVSERENDTEWEGFESVSEELLTKTKRPERKTQAQRNRIRRRKEAEQLALKEAMACTKELEAQQALRIAKELARCKVEKVEMSNRGFSTGSSDQDERMDDDVDADDAHNLRRKQLGKFRLPQKELELVLPGELQDSLRLLKPEGNLLNDRYRNMIVRGKMEARRKLFFKRQGKATWTETWKSKDFQMPT